MPKEKKRKSTIKNTQITWGVTGGQPAQPEAFAASLPNVRTLGGKILSKFSTKISSKYISKIPKESQNISKLLKFC